MSLLKFTKLSDKSVHAFEFDRPQTVVDQAALAPDEVPQMQGPASPPGHLTQPNPNMAKSVIDTDELLARIADLEEALQQAKAEHEDALAAAIENGRKEGFETADKRAQEALATLRSGVEAATSTLAADLDQQLDTGIAIAQAIITQVLGTQREISELVIQTTRKWLKELHRSQILKLRVSAADFEQSGQLDELRELLDDDLIELDPKLEQGSCIFDLTLGKLDASLPLQLENAQRHLDQVASKGDIT